MLINNNRERNRFLKFAVVGIIGAVVDFGTFNIFSAILQIQAVVASIFSFVLAVSSNFVWNRYWTYPDSRSKPLSKQLVQFLVFSFLGLAIRTPLFAWLEKTLVSIFTEKIPTITVSPTFLGHNLSLAIVILVIMFWNFFANRFWTYNDVE